MLQFLLRNNFCASVNSERISVLISALTFGCEHTLLLDLASSIRKVGENTTKNPTLESILNLPQLQKILAIWLHRWIPCGFAFYLASGNALLTWIPWNSQENPAQRCLTWSASDTLSQETRQKSMTEGWQCFPTLCWLDFLLLGFGLHFIPR